MSNASLIVVFFFYGLAFYSMGLAILLELGRGRDSRLRFALRPLAVFSLLHGTHEWVEMFQLMGLTPDELLPFAVEESLRIIFLSFSFLSLAAFGAYLLAENPQRRRVSMLVPLGMAALWGFGALYFRGQFGAPEELWRVVDVWTRYSLGIPAAVLASAGLIVQQRVFRQSGMPGFGRDALWAAVAFAWYGLVGQVFITASRLPPSHLINSELFRSLFGFPIQFVRAGAAVVAAIFIIRVLRAFEVEMQNQIDQLQAAKLAEAQERESLQRELFKRVVEAQEAERQRIARELHDETGQSLTAIGLGLRGAAGSLQQNPEKSTQNLRQLETMVAGALTELQRLITDLRPSHLDDLGLPAALRWYGGVIQERLPLKVDVEIQGEPVQLSPEVNTAIFRIVQEALNNVVKHAQASQVSVQLRYEPQAIHLWVRDNGKGFDMGMLTTPQRPSWGLVGMQERAALLGGTLRIASAPRLGTLAELVLPYPPGSKGNEHADSTAAGG